MDTEEVNIIENASSRSLKKVNDEETKMVCHLNRIIIS